MLVRRPQSSGNRPASERRYPHRASFGPERRSMVDDEPLLILPLVHHLVQKRVHRFVPAVAANVAPADNNFRLAAFCRRTVVAESAAHPSRDAYWNLAQLAAEPLVVVGAVPLRELSYQRHVRGMGLLRGALATRRFRFGDRKFQDGATRRVARDARPSVHEGDDRLPHLLTRLEEAVVDAKLTAAVADDYRSVRGQSHPILRPQAESLETRAQFLRICRWRFIQLQHELVAITQAPHTPSV